MLAADAFKMRKFIEFYLSIRQFWREGEWARNFVKCIAGRRDSIHNLRLNLLWNGYLDDWDRLGVFLEMEVSWVVLWLI